MNSKIIGIVILIVAIGGSSAYFLTKNDSVDIDSFSNQSISQNEKISLVINTINPPKSIDDLEEAYKVASTSGAGRTNLYVHWNQLEPEKGNFDWRVTDIMMKLNEKYNFKTTLFLSVINADRLGPFPSWMGYQVIGKTLESDTARVLNEILSRYENIDYVIFAADIDYHFQRAPGAIPNYTEFFNNISSEIKLNHPDVKIGNSISLDSLEKIIFNKGFESAAIGSENKLLIYVIHNKNLSADFLKADISEIIGINQTAIQINVVSDLHKVSSKLLSKGLIKRAFTIVGKYPSVL